MYESKQNRPCSKLKKTKETASLIILTHFFWWWLKFG